MPADAALPPARAADAAQAAVRVDSWLWAVRIYKTRSQATAACRAGHVKVADERAKASQSVRPGDEVRVRVAGAERILVVRRTLVKRVGPAIAAEAMTDLTPPGVRELGEDPRPQRVRPLGEAALLGRVARLARGLLDAHRLETQAGHVVRARAHVERADVAGQLERVEQHLAGHERAELRGPLVDVHAGVQAAGLLEVRLGLAGGRERVPRHGLGREEAEGVDVGARQLVGLDDLVGRGGSEAERQALMPLLAGPDLVDHRPLVQAEAGEAPGARGGAAEDPLDEGRGGSAGPEVRGRVDPHPTGRAASVRDVPAPRRALVVRRVREHDARARVPAAEERRLVRVVGEEEVVDLVGAAGEAARAEPRGEGVGAVGVAGCPVVPGGGSQDRGRVARGAVGRRRRRRRGGRGIGG
ncbi:ribosome-associated heat shock protein Hsp15 [Clavibacter michiganensis subsp. michiganensis]|nr:ribosome-associated heat shock protein Hsp15 [Clavibacter michiganensis subsp. michiganensis]